MPPPRSKKILTRGGGGDKVLNMEDIYIRDSQGLRIIAANRSLVKGQLFYILAEGPNEDEGQNIFFSRFQSLR